MLRLCLVLALLSGMPLAAAQGLPVAEDECAAWCDHLVPLPQEIAIKRMVVLVPQAVGIRLCAEAGEIEQQALSDLTALFKAKAGVEPTGNGFEIRIGVLDAEGQLNGIAVSAADRLKTLPNRDQAYTIQPSGESKLIVAALDPKGVYHGVQTLRQLLGPKLTKDQVVIPLATIVDWPDLDERGLWNFDMALIPWITSLKMNFAKVPTAMRPVRRDQPVRVNVDPKVLVAGRMRALKAVPTVKHLNYIGAKHGGYEAYPELAGKGDEAVPTIWYKPRRIRVPCAACPALKKIIAEYMVCMASKGAQEVSVWLSEFRGQCQCDTCLEAGQLRMETRAACEGWLEARKQYPHLVLRIFYCMGGKSLDDTYQALMELPAEVKIEYCYGRYGKAFDKAAAAGRWLASYAGRPLPDASYTGLRFHGAPRIRKHVLRLLDRKWRAVYSINYVYSNGTYQRAFWDFHVHALAEWSWNLNGRSIADLARAWATRAGYARPKHVAEWVAAMAPIERSLHYALTTRNWGKLSEALKAGEPLRPSRGVLAGFPNSKTLDEQLTACERALSIVEETGAQDLILETQYVAALVRSLKALNALLAQVTQDPHSEALAELRQGTEDLAKAFDAKMDLVKAEPRDFAEATKKQHAEMWTKRVKDISDALP